MNARLSLATLHRVPVSVRPPIDPREISVGIVHLGVGAFHRAHQALYTQAAMAASGDLTWGICGVSQRSRGVVDRLAPQDGLYSVLVRGTDTRAAVLVPLRELLFARDQPDELTARIAAPDTRIVTLTVTETGYRADPEGAVGQLVRGLARRRRDGAGPLTVVSCDNLAGNGALLRRLVTQVAETEGGSADVEWIGRHVRFPSTMVDRIVPATTQDDARQVAALIGLDDRAPVVAEPFSQWVIEDDFAGPRPRWEAVGAQLVPDVAPYEAMKLRLLNGAHSALAYLGLLAGYEYLDEAVADGGLRAYAVALMDRDATPTLDVPTAVDLAAYKAEILRRFENPGLRYPLAQIARDGSRKLPQRLVPVIVSRRAEGAMPRYAVLAVAAWMCCADRGREDAGLVDDLLGEIFGEEMRADGELRGELGAGLRSLHRHGATASVHELLAH